jgi:hypothetical protein
MAKQLDKRVKDLLAKHDINPREACWDCHGSWVIYHKYCEIIAAKAGITFDPPNIIEASIEKQTVVLCVTGRMGDRAEWSFGEASPDNLKGGAKTFPYAMAEKRGKDRVILKLAGIHGLVYSEEEADDFKKGPSRGPTTSLAQKVASRKEEVTAEFLDDDEVREQWNRLSKAHNMAGLSKADAARSWQEAIGLLSATSGKEIPVKKRDMLDSFIDKACKSLAH